MIRGLLVFGGAFTMSASLSVFGSGCSSYEDNCPATPAHPEAQEPLVDLAVASYDARGESAEIEVQPEAGGSIEVTGGSVVIVYQQAGVEHRITYAVTGPR